MIIESLASTAATLGGGFFVGVLIGYALKKVIKLVPLIVSCYCSFADDNKFIIVISFRLTRHKNSSNL
jgi:uncharacterized membrane protein (Fun14 family)